MAERAAQQQKPQAQTMQAPVAAPAAPPRADQIDRAALAAIAEAVSPAERQAQAQMQPAAYGDVSVRPIPPKPSMFPEQEQPMQHVHEPAPPAAFIPQPAERMPLRAPRMPQFEELPVPAQNEIRRARGEVTEEPAHPQKTRTSLLQRLANVGLGRRDEDSEPPIAARGAGPAMPQMPPLPERKQQRPIPQQYGGGDPVSEYARRPAPAPQGLDSHGRPAPVAPQGGEDHLDIPAFLRRQAN
jgi:cell division protein FtsZ